MLRTSGQTTVQLLVPLFLLLLLVGAFALFLPDLTNIQTIGFGLGVVLFVVCLASTEAAIYVLIFSMLLSPEFIVGTTGGASLGRGVTVRLDDFIILIIGFSWVAKMAVHKGLDLFPSTPLNRPIALYIVACLISTLVGAIIGNVSLKTGLLFVLKYFEYVFIYFMVVNHLETKEQAKRYVWAILATAAIVSFIGILQIPEGGRVSAPFEGERGEPNTFGGYLVFMIAISTGLGMAAVSLRNRIAYFALAFLFAIPLVYTQSRSSYLAFPFAMLALGFLARKHQWVVLVPILAGLALVFVSPEAFRERVAYTFEQGEGRTDVVEIMGVKLDTSTSARIKSWGWVLRDWQHRPILGYGVTGHAFVDAQYFRVLIETGLIGLVIFLFLIIKIYNVAVQVLSRCAEEFDFGLVTGCIAGFIGLLVHAVGANTFIIVRIMEPFWFVLALLVVFTQLQSKSNR